MGFVAVYQGMVMGKGNFKVKRPISPASSLKLENTNTFGNPGIYFAPFVLFLKEMETSVSLTLEFKI